MAQLGARRTSLPMRALDGVTAVDLLAYSRDSGVQIEALSAAPVIRLDDPTGWAAQQQTLELAIELVAAVGAGTVYCLTGGPGAAPWTEAIAAFAEFLVPNPRAGRRTWRPAGGRAGERPLCRSHLRAHSSRRRRGHPSDPGARYLPGPVSHLDRAVPAPDDHRSHRRHHSRTTQRSGARRPELPARRSRRRWHPA